MKELKFFSKESLIDVILISIIGIILHFTFEFSGGNILVALFSAVNNSIGEHIKIAVIAMYIVSLVKMSVKENREYNLWTSLFFKFITVIILITALYYIYKAIFIVESLIIDIFIFYISIVIARLVEVVVQAKLKISAKVEDIYKYLNIAIILLFIIFTFIPPKLDIFKDIINMEYKRRKLCQDKHGNLVL